MRQKNTLLIMLFVVTAFNVQSQSLSDSLHAHYNFDGDLLDATSNNHDLSLNSGNVSYAFESLGDSSIYFDGSSSISTISNFDNSSFTEMAVSLWVKTDNITSDLQVCLQGSNIGFGIYIQANTGHFIGFFDGTSSGAAVSPSPIADDLWHHVVIQNDGNTTYMFVDGELETSIPDALNVGNGASNNKLYFGRSNLGIQPFTGNLNDARIYSRLLSLHEIESLYYGTGTVSLNEPGSPGEIDVSIYPNPTHQNIVVDLKSVHEVVDVEIIDVLGKTLYTESNQNNQYLTFDLNGQTGVYFVKVSINGRSFVYKVIKE